VAAIEAAVAQAAASASASAPTAAAPAAVRRTIVDEGTELKGSLTSSCPVVVMGRLEGDVTAPALEVAVGGAVSGKVKVNELRSAGELAGEVDADRVRISGTVKDRTVVRAQSLEVALRRDDGKIEVVFGSGKP
jgi:cytoskeletal protein CcmA (bactofilin family)